MEHETEEKATTRSRKGLITAFFWLLFSAGLVLQVFSPHLAIEHNSFVIPATAVARGGGIDPPRLVARQRAFQAASATLVLIGTIGLAMSYRELISRSLSGK
jgi:hypothetical protein